MALFQSSTGWGQPETIHYTLLNDQDLYEKIKVVIDLLPSGLFSLLYLPHPASSVSLPFFLFTDLSFLLSMGDQNIVYSCVVSFLQEVALSGVIFNSHTEECHWHPMSKG